MLKKIVLSVFLIVTLASCSLGSTMRTVDIEPFKVEFQTTENVKVISDTDSQYAVEGTDYSVLFSVSENDTPFDTWKKDLETELFAGGEESPRLVYSQEAIGDNAYQWTYRDPAGTFQTVRIMVVDVDGTLYRFQATGVSENQESAGLTKIFESLSVGSA